MTCYFILTFIIALELGVTIISSQGRDRRPDGVTWGRPDDRPPSETELRNIIRALATNISTTESDHNPCVEPQLPDFSGPGRRISQVKCYEFVWHLANRNEMKYRQAACKGYYLAHPIALGGRNAWMGEFPHMAGIGWKATVGDWIFKCGGSLISSRFVLTAAHCTRASSRDTTVADTVPKIVRVGSKNILDDKLQANVVAASAYIAQIIVHPSYNPPQKYFDIALLKLEKDVEFSEYVQPACLWAIFDTSNIKQVTATGWGVVETKHYTTSPYLQVVEIDLIDGESCDRLLRRWRGRNWGGLSDHQICAGNLSGGVDTCQGDSGGPLQSEMKLPPSDQGLLHHVVGVTSFGIGCGRSNTPGVYTRVSSFIDWIESIVWPQ